jgi:Homeodomain-like domain
MQTELEMRQLLAGLALAKVTHNEIADRLSVPRPTFRNWVYRFRTIPPGMLDRIWSALAEDNVERVRARGDRGPGVRYIEIARMGSVPSIDGQQNAEDPQGPRHDVAA